MGISQLACAVERVDLVRNLLLVRYKPANGTLERVDEKVSLVLDFLFIFVALKLTLSLTALIARGLPVTALS